MKRLLESKLIFEKVEVKSQQGRKVLKGNITSAGHSSRYLWGYKGNLSSEVLDMALAVSRPYYFCGVRFLCTPTNIFTEIEVEFMRVDLT